MGTVPPGLLSLLFLCLESKTAAAAAAREESYYLALAAATMRREREIEREKGPNERPKVSAKVGASIVRSRCPYMWVMVVVCVCINSRGLRCYIGGVGCCVVRVCRMG
jgi:hypothetical protein